MNQDCLRYVSKIPKRIPSNYHKGLTFSYKSLLTQENPIVFEVIERDVARCYPSKCSDLYFQRLLESLDTTEFQRT
jgi:hypothetical protein